jgi:hypothetical protein
MFVVQRIGRMPMSLASRKRRRFARRAIFPAVYIEGVGCAMSWRHPTIDLRDTGFNGGDIIKASSDRRRITILLPEAAR